MISTYKSGSDIIEKLSYNDQDGDGITLADLTAYGVEVFTPKGVSIGVWGVNTDTEDSAVFKAHDADTAILKLDLATYGASRGIFEAVLYIKYPDTDFDDTFRDLYSERKQIFKVI